MDKPFAQDLFEEDKIPEQLYLVPSWQQQMDLLGHLCQYSQNLLLLLSPNGTGKTSFTKLLSDYKLPGLRKIVLDGKKLNDTNELMRAISTGFHLPWPLEGEFKLFDDLEIQDDKSLTWTVIIDNADCLTPEVVKSLVALMDFDLPPKQQLRVVLVGQPSLELLVGEPSVTEHLGDKVHPLELNSWSQADIEFILKENNKKISPKFIQAIQEQSGGRPSAVVDRLNLVFLGQADIDSEGQSHWIQYVDKPVIFGLSFGVVLGMSFLLFNFGESELPTQAPINVAVQEDKTSESEIQKGDVFVEHKVFSTESDQVATQTKAQTKPTQLVAANLKSVEPKVAVIAEEPKQKIAQTKGQVKKVHVAKKEQIVKTPPVFVAKQEEYIAKPQTMSVKKTEAKAVVAKVAAAKSNMTVGGKDDSGLFELSSDEQKILAHSGKGYTLQLMGSKTPPNVNRFLKKNNLKDKAKLIRVNRDGNSWYVIVYGSYPSYKQAKQAASEISRGTKVQPWVRTNKSVQSDIKRVAEMRGGSGFVILPSQDEKNRDVG